MPGPQGPHKILVIGEPGIGKTSLIRRYVDNVFDKNYTATLGVDFALKVVPWENNMQIQLQLWDIAGQERFSSMTRVYYKQATACVIIFDITRYCAMGDAPLSCVNSIYRVHVRGDKPVLSSQPIMPITSILELESVAIRKRTCD